MILEKGMCVRSKGSFFKVIDVDLEVSTGHVPIINMFIGHFDDRKCFIYSSVPKERDLDEHGEWLEDPQVFRKQQVRWTLEGFPLDEDSK
jgi:hypothetical protein